VIVSVLLGALVLLGLYVGSHRLSGVQAGIVVMLALVGLTLVVFPRVASITAQQLGVGRGTDLLLYSSIMGGLFVAANLYFRSKRQEEQIVIMARALALAKAEWSFKPQITSQETLRPPAGAGTPR